MTFENFTQLLGNDLKDFEIRLGAHRGLSIKEYLEHPKFKLLNHRHLVHNAFHWHNESARWWEVAERK